MHPDSHTHTDAHTRTIHEEEMYLAVSTEQALSSRLDGDNCRVIIIFSFRLIAISASAILMHQPRKIDYLLLSYIKNDFYAPAICSQIVPPYSSAHPSYFVRPYFSFSLSCTESTYIRAIGYVFSTKNRERQARFARMQRNKMALLHTGNAS